MAELGESIDLVQCSFCAKRPEQVKKMVAGPRVYICDECVELCTLIIACDVKDHPELEDSSGKVR